MDEIIKNSEKLTTDEKNNSVEEAVIPEKVNKECDNSEDSSEAQEISEDRNEEIATDPELIENNFENYSDTQVDEEENSTSNEAAEYTNNPLSNDELDSMIDKIRSEYDENTPPSDPDTQAPILSPDEIFSIPSPKDAQEADEDDSVDEPPTEMLEEDGQYKFVYIEDSFEDEEEDVEPDMEEPEAVAPKYNPEKPRRVDMRFDLVELFIFTLIAVMIITSFFFRHSIVDGESMENTLHDGEHLIISDFLYTPKRGDIIVCEDYTTSIKKPIVKRVIAVAGDTIEITREGKIFVNDKLIDESNYVFIDEKNYEYDELPLMTVPKGEIFVMGDHRNQSKDSRAPDVGCVSVDSVIGKVLLRFYPFDKFGTVD